MSQTPSVPMDFLTEYGHSPPMCTQYSVFLENRVGRLHDLVELFDEQAIRVVAFAILEASDHAVVRMLTTKSDLARQLLNDERMPYSETELLVVELAEDQRLAQLCRALLSAELSIRYSYSLMARPHGSTTVAIRCDDQTLGGQILQRKGFKLVDEQELARAAGEDPNVA